MLVQLEIVARTINRGSVFPPTSMMTSHVLMSVTSTVHGHFPDPPKSWVLSVMLVGDRAIHRINREFLGHDYPTDVIAFPLGDASAPGDVEGEIYVSGDHAVREAKGRPHPWRVELALYLVHGTLHLCGHDDHAAKARARMLRREQVVLRRLGYAVRDRR